MPRVSARDRFDALTKCNPRLFDVAAAAELEYKRLRTLSSANPTFLAPLVEQTYAMHKTGRSEELIRVADLIARPDVTAAIDEVARRETFPIYSIGF